MVEADRSFSLRAVFMLIGQHHKWGGLFPLGNVNRGRIWNSSFWETVYVFLDYKKMSGWIFNNIGWLFSHTVVTQLCSNTFKNNIPLLDARCLWALRRHCITHQHDSVIDITKWAQEYFDKPLLVNTIRHPIFRCQLKLYHAKIKPYLNMVQKGRHVLWTKAHLKLTVSKWKSVLWSNESKWCDILVGNLGHRVLRAKEEGDPPACYRRSVQKPASLIVWGA